MAEKEYVYGVGPEGSGIGQLLSSLLPVRREVIEPYEETFIESPNPNQMERVVTPGQYGEPELAVPQAVQAFMNFKGLARDPEAREAVLRGIGALPELPAELSRRAQISAQAGLAQEEALYDPERGTAVGSEELLLAAPLLTAPGTALSIARAGDQGGTVLGMMGGKNAVGPVGEAATQAEKMFDEGRRETAVYRKTGAIRATENKPAVFIDAAGEGGLDTSKFESLIETPSIHGSLQTLNFIDYVDFPNGVEAYPELKDFKIQLLDDQDPLWEKNKADVAFEYAPTSEMMEGLTTYLPLPTFYVKSAFNVRDNSFKFYSKRNIKAKFALAIQDYISQKEGFVRPELLNPKEQQSETAAQARKAESDFRYNIERPQGYDGPRQTLSPMDEYRASLLGYPAKIEETTTSPLAQSREAAMRYSSNFTSPERYKEDVIRAYGDRKLDVYPTYFGDLMGDMNNPAKFTIDYQSPLFDIIENLPQEKGTGNQFLAAIKKAGVKQEDLLYSGLESFLTNRNSVTKSEIRDRLYEREVPVYEKFLEDDKGKTNFFPISYTTGSGSDGFELAKEAELRDPRSLALITQTDPLTGVAATGATVGLHDELPKNTFAHMRFNTRTIRVNGKPIEVLFIDEIQSDWHQRGAKLVSDLIELEAPNPETGKKSGKIVGGQALDELVDQRLEQVPDIQYDRTIPNKIVEEAMKKTQEITGFKLVVRPAVRKIYKQEYAKAAKKILDISDAEIKAYAKKKVYGAEDSQRALILPDGAFKDNWYELSFRRLVREAVEEGLDGVAFTPDYLQNARYGKQNADPKDQFAFYDKVLAPYVQKYAKRHGTKLETAEQGSSTLRFANNVAMEKAGYSSDLPVYYMPLSDEIKKMYRKPIPTYAMGGGVGSMAPVATNMFRGYDDVRRGVGAYAPLIRRA